MLGVLPFRKDPDLSANAVHGFAQLLPPCLQEIQKNCEEEIMDMTDRGDNHDDDDDNGEEVEDGGHRQQGDEQAS